MKKPKLRSENLVKKDIKKRLQEWGAWFFCPPASVYGKSGIPDFIACVPVEVTPDMVGETVGLFVAIEAKAEGRRGEADGGATPLQVLAGTGIMRASGIMLQTDTADNLKLIEEVLKFTPKEENK